MNPVKEINELLAHVFIQGITDIHLEANKQFFRIRIRKDGILKTIKSYPPAEGSAYLARIKVMANLDINGRTPQDGRFTFEDSDVRVATLPLYRGEKIVLRLLRREKHSLSLTELGMPLFMIEELKQIIKKMAGLILLTGPTGSGKTTTLYSLLNLCDASRFNIITLEDPVEYHMSEVNQVQINNSGLSFSAVLRNVLRQDPDIIFIGEIRDPETAAIALRAALTGHLVFATLHTRDSQEALIRLRDLGVPEYLLKGTIRCVLAQRLYRKICQSCLGQGCPKCEGDGFGGRSAIFEYYDPERNFKYDFATAKTEVLGASLTRATELFFI